MASKLAQLTAELRVATRASVTEIKVTSGGKETGRMSEDAFRKHMGIRSGFTADLIKKFNAEKKRRGEPERAEQVIKGKRTAGEGDLAKTVPAALKWIDRLIGAAEKAKRELKSKKEPLRDTSAFVSVLKGYRNEDWYDHFFG